MTTTTMTFFNAALHSFILAALGWVLVRWCIRDARRRDLAAQMALIFAIIAPCTVSMWPYPYPAKDAPALGRLHQPLQPGWRIQVSTLTAESSVPAIHQAPAPLWTINDAARILLWIWAAGAGMLLLRHFMLSFRLARWRKSLRKPTAEELAGLPCGIEGKQLRVFDHPGTPCVAGLLAPVIAVPASAFQTQTAGQWHWMMRHEEEHIRGRDLGVSWLLGIIRAVGWWNPFIHALIECWTRAREEVCDAAAVRNTQAHAAYAEFLLAVASVRHAPMIGVMPISQSKPARRLRARLEALMASQSVRDRAGWVFHLTCLIVIVFSHALIASLGFTASVRAAESAPSAVSEKDGNEEMFVCIYRVPPNFGDGAEVKDFLGRQGVTFPGHAAIKFNKATSQIIARNTRANLKRMEQVVKAAFISPVQVVFSAKVIAADRYFGQHGQVLSEPEFQALIRNASQTKGVNLISSPSVTTRLEQSAMIEVAREQEPKEDSKFMGVRLHLYSQAPNGTKIKAKIKMELGIDPSGKSLVPPTEQEGPDWTQVQVFTTEAEPLLASGETAILRLPAARMFVTLFVTATAIKPDGNPAGGFHEKFNNAPAPWRGDNALLPADTYEREQQHARDVEAALARQQIELSVGLAKVSSADVAEEIAELLGITPGKQPASSPPGGAPFITGVLTDPQFTVIKSVLNKHDTTQLVALPRLTVADEETAVFALPQELGGRELKITSALGADGKVIDLSIATAILEGGGKNITTSVSLWDGQTVVLNDPGDEKDGAKKSRPLIFVTARVIDHLDKPKSK